MAQNSSVPNSTQARSFLLAKESLLVFTRPMMIRCMSFSLVSARIWSALASLLIVTATAGCAFNIVKPLTLKSPPDRSAETPLRIRTLKVAAPPAGSNVFVFEDVTSGATVPITAPGPTGGMITRYFVVPAGLKRADFFYALAHDSGPMFSAAMKDLFKEDQGSSVGAQVVADFKYGLMERKENVNLGWGNTNMVGLYMVVQLVLNSREQVLLDKNYTAIESDSYSTRWVTTPDNEFLDILFQKAIRSITSQIARDPDVAKHF